jgi:glyoxylase-like metal-dependent hydrolase (beta-lactamase superfamily II)
VSVPRLKIGPAEVIESFHYDALAARLAEAERLLRYWLPDEALLAPGHDKAWNDTLKWLADSATGDHS